jgi:hypothetical protein
MFIVLYCIEFYSQQPNLLLCFFPNLNLSTVYAIIIDERRDLCIKSLPTRTKCFWGQRNFIFSSIRHFQSHPHKRVFFIFVFHIQCGYSQHNITRIILILIQTVVHGQEITDRYIGSQMRFIEKRNNSSC